MVSTAILGAIGMLLTGLFTGKYFLIWIAAILFFIGSGTISLVSNQWWITLIVVLVIIIILTKNK